MSIFRILQVDIETLSLSNHNAVVCEVGTELLVLEGNTWGRRQYEWRLSVDEQLSMGREIDDATLEWWKSTNQELYSEVTSGTTSLAKFRSEFVAVCAKEADLLSPLSASSVWATAPRLDFGNIENILGTLPWVYHKERDLRVLRGMMADLPPRDQENVLHSAIGDACYQNDIILHAWTTEELRTPMARLLSGVMPEVLEC